MGLPLDLEGLVVNVERRVVVLAEDPLAVIIRRNRAARLYRFWVASSPGSSRF